MTQMTSPESRVSIATGCSSDAAQRARLSRGISTSAVYEMVERALARRNIRGGRIVDVGCGIGNLYPFVGHRFSEYVGVDVIRYDGLPSEVEFIPFELNSENVPVNAGTADVVVAVETIEHLENPRMFMRHLVKIAKPGGWVVVTTPNQLSLLSLLALALKRRFVAFQDVHYPAHLTALLEIDLMRIGAECELSSLVIEYSLAGRIVLTSRHYPSFLARVSPRMFSDNVLLIGRKAVASKPPALGRVQI